MLPRVPEPVVDTGDNSSSNSTAEEPEPDPAAQNTTPLVLTDANALTYAATVVLKTGLRDTYFRNLLGVDCRGKQYAEALAEAWAKTLVNESFTLAGDDEASAC